MSRAPRTTGRDRSRSCASRVGDYVCQSVALLVSEGDIVDRVGMELEARNTGVEKSPVHQSGLLLEERNLDSRNRRRPVWLHGIERSPSLHDSSLLNVVHQLRAALARPWPLSAYAEVSGRSESKSDHCGGIAARGVSGRIRQLHALVRQQAVKRRVFDREGVA